MLEPGNESTLRLLYYPPLGAPAPGLARCGAHCDYGTFTLLAQVGYIYKNTFFFIQPIILDRTLIEIELPFVCRIAKVV